MANKTYSVLLLTCILFLFLAACAGGASVVGGASVAGKYECPVKGVPSFYLDLNNDNSFWLKKPSNEEITGKWKVIGSDVQLESPMLTYASFPSRLQIVGNTLVVKRYEGAGGTMVFMRR